MKGIGLRDIKGPLDFPSNFAFLLLIIGLSLAIGAVWGWIIWAKKKKAKRPDVSKSAYEIACAQFEALAAKDLIGRLKIKEYYIEISDIVRHYLENGFRLNAPEMTTEEFLNNLKDSPQLAKNHKGLLKEFLVSCDMVKFAKYAPAAKEIDSVYYSAKNFIDQTKDELL